MHELPGVGRHLLDHLAVVTIVECNEPVTLAAAESLRNVGRFLVAGRGMLTSNVAEACAFVRTRDDLPAPDLELVFAPVTFLDHGLEPPTGHGLTIGAVALQPRSEGELTLASADPARPPIIDPAYLSDDGGDDLRVLVDGMRRAREIFAAPAFARYAGKPMYPSPTPIDDDEAADHVRRVRGVALPPGRYVHDGQRRGRRRRRRPAGPRSRAAPGGRRVGHADDPAWPHPRFHGHDRGEGVRPHPRVSA